MKYSDSNEKIFIILRLQILGKANFIAPIFWLWYFFLPSPAIHQWALVRYQHQPKSNCPKGNMISVSFRNKLFHTWKFCNISPNIGWKRISHFSQTLDWTNFKICLLPPYSIHELVIDTSFLHWAPKKGKFNVDGKMQVRDFYNFLFCSFW